MKRAPSAQAPTEPGPDDDSQVLPSEQTLGLEILDAAVHNSSHPLAAWTPPDRPGVYLLHFVGQPCRSEPRWRRAYRQLCGWPIYAGMASSLRERTGRHRLTLASTANLEVVDFRITVVPTATKGAAALGELELQRMLQPLWCELWMSGFGSKSIGSQRLGQARSAWATRHPRSGTGSGHAQISAAEISKRINEHVAAATARPHRWPL